VPAAATSSTATRTSRRSSSNGELHAGIPFSQQAVAAAGCVVMLTRHREFTRDPWWGRARLVVDTRHVVPAAPHVRSIAAPRPCAS
jgi:UDP-N-acetyl-D-mannosaminuronate dehydrogenase